MVGLEDVVVFYVRISFYSERLVLSRLGINLVNS
jgi:hypothetical protein